MSKKSINPLNIHKVRRAVFCPPYFESMTLPSPLYMRLNLISINSWIYINMSGRYFLGAAITVDDNSSIVVVQNVAFENPSELSLFMLSCPYLK
tara:strand:- start:128 stop:409 length:282 start_codon:yes stop_codon:yes gene_type:complete